MYRIAVLSDHKENGQKYADQIMQFCTEKGFYPLVEFHQNPTDFFHHILQTKPTSVLLALSGVAGLNAAEHLHSLLPDCGLIWCSDLDFSLHAFRLRAEYFILEPVSEEALQEGLLSWLKQRKQHYGIMQRQ